MARLHFFRLLYVCVLENWGQTRSEAGNKTDHKGWKLSRRKTNTASLVVAGSQRWKHALPMVWRDWKGRMLWLLKQIWGCRSENTEVTYTKTINPSLFQIQAGTLASFPATNRDGFGEKDVRIKNERPSTQVSQTFCEANVLASINQAAERLCNACCNTHQPVVSYHSLSSTMHKDEGSLPCENCVLEQMSTTFSCQTC